MVDGIAANLCCGAAARHDAILMKGTRPIQVSFAVLTIAFVSWVLHCLWDARLWPFSTGTRDEAFLGATFGMSAQEVSRAVAKHGAQLLAYADYRRSEPSPSINRSGFTPLFSDDRKDDSSFFMSSIEMFDSKVEAQFSFRHSRLASVGVYIDPIAHSKAESVVAALESKLRTTYQFSGREESPHVPGAYTLHFKSATGIRSLWVNLTTRERPIIILTVTHPTTEMDRKREIQNRERTAFGGSK
jgi:hypothetical protein